MYDNFYGETDFLNHGGLWVYPIVVKQINGLWIIKGHFALTFGPLMSQLLLAAGTFLFQGREYVKVGFEAVYQRTDGETFIYLCPNAAWLMNLPKQAGKV